MPKSRKPAKRAAKPQTTKKAKKTKGGGSALRDKLRRANFRDRMNDTKQRMRSKSFFKTDVDIPFWKCAEGQHLIDIVPYIAGANDPMVEEGTGTYRLLVFTHRDVGNVEGQQVICLAKTYGERCPICDHVKQLRHEGADEDLINELTPSNYGRAIYNIVCYDSRREEDKGIQVWHTSEYLFEQHLTKLAERPLRRGSDEVDSFIDFADPDEGKSISFTTEGKQMNTKHMGMQFVDRDYEIEDELLESALCLDDLIHKPTYEEVYKLYWDEDPEGEDADEDEEDEEERPARGGRGRSRKPKQSRSRQREEDEDDADDDDDYEDVDDEDIEEDDYEEAEEGDDAPECPAGGVFGEDCNDHDECEDCDAWDECYRLSEGGEDEEEMDERPRRSRKPKKTSPKRSSKGGKRQPAKPSKRRKLSRRR